VADKSRPGPAQPPPRPPVAGTVVHAIHLVQAAAVAYALWLAVLLKWAHPGALGLGMSLVRARARRARRPPARPSRPFPQEVGSERRLKTCHRVRRSCPASLLHMLAGPAPPAGSACAEHAPQRAVRCGRAAGGRGPGRGLQLPLPRQPPQEAAAQRLCARPRPPASGRSAGERAPPEPAAAHTWAAACVHGCRVRKWSEAAAADTGRPFVHVEGPVWRAAAAEGWLAGRAASRRMSVAGAAPLCSLSRSAASREAERAPRRRAAEPDAGAQGPARGAGPRAELGRVHRPREGGGVPRIG